MVPGAVLLLLSVLYFIPSVIAWTNDHHPNRIGVFILNLFLGWSLVGWVVALAWSFSQSLHEPGAQAAHRQRVGAGYDGVRTGEPMRLSSRLLDSDKPGYVDRGILQPPAYVDLQGRTVHPALIDPIQFTGIRSDASSGPIVYVETADGNQAQLLDPGRPASSDLGGQTGVDWGYSGTGPVVLAELILDLCIVQVPSSRLATRFVEDVVANLPEEGFSLEASAVVTWISTVIGK